MSPIRFIRRLLLAAEEAVNASVDRALGEEVPLSDLLADECPGCAAADEQASAEAYDDIPEKLGPTAGDAAEVARDEFIRAGWVEVAPGYWANPKAAHAHLDDFLADPEGYARAES